MEVYRLLAYASKEDTSWARHRVSATVSASMSASDTGTPYSNSSSISVMVIPLSSESADASPDENREISIGEPSS